MKPILAALLLTACAFGTTAPSPSPTPVPQTLEGRAFVSTTVVRNGAPFTLAPNTRLRLEFRNGQLFANAGCNGISGSYSINDNVLVVKGLGQTEMACPALMEQEAWLVQTLQARPVLALDGNSLTMTRGDDVVTFLDGVVAEPDAHLDGVTWVVESLIEGESASSVPQGATASLAFEPGGRLQIKSGCNTGFGRYSVDGDVITLTDVSITAMGCAGAPAQLEQSVMTVLNAGRVHFSLDGQSLTLDAGAAGLQLIAQ
jgi:heat shock protein HslJ